MMIRFVFVDRRKTKMTNEDFKHIADSVTKEPRGIRFANRGWPPVYTVSIPEQCVVVEGDRGTISLAVDVPEAYTAFLNHYKPTKIEFVDLAMAQAKVGLPLSARPIPVTEGEVPDAK